MAMAARVGTIQHEIQEKRKGMRRANRNIGDFYHNESHACHKATKFTLEAVINVFDNLFFIS
jgi:hypothetical protein